MSLDWDLTKIKDSKTVCWVDDPEHPDDDSKARLNPVTEQLIFETMFTGIGWEVTEANAAEFYARIKLREKLGGLSLNEIRDGKLVYVGITVEDVKAHVGLRTNVTPETRSAFIKRWVTPELDREKRAFADKPERQPASK